MYQPPLLNLQWCHWRLMGMCHLPSAELTSDVYSVKPIIRFVPEIVACLVEGITCPVNSPPDVYIGVPVINLDASPVANGTFTYQSLVLVLKLYSLSRNELLVVLALTNNPFENDRVLELDVNKYTLSSSNVPSMITDVPQWKSG